MKSCVNFGLLSPHSTSTPKKDNTPIIRMRNISLGQTALKIVLRNIKIFDRERTVIDSFRYLDKEIALKALKAYLTDENKKSKPDIDKLL